MNLKELQTWNGFPWGWFGWTTMGLWGIPNAGLNVPFQKPPDSANQALKPRSWLRHPLNQTKVPKA